MAQDSKTLIFVLTRLNRRGGQEVSTLEVLERLQRKGWTIYVLSYVFEDIPVGAKFQWHRVPFYGIPTHWLRDLWLGIYSWVWLKFFAPPGVVATVGLGSWTADVRVIQFFHSRLRAWVKAGRAVFPMSQSWLRRTYQEAYSVWNCFLEKTLFPETPHLIAISETVATDLVELSSVRREQIQVIHHAPTPIQPRAVSSEKMVRILFVGALERKGIEKALRVLVLLKHLSWQFDVVGDGDLGYWKNFSRELGISERVQFHGVRPSQLYFPKADMFLFPSLYEPFGLVVTEAIAAGLAVVASSQCGALELWSGRPDFLRLSAQDSDSQWAEAVARLIQEPDLREKLVREAQVSVSSWNWDLAAERYDEVFTKCLK